jgi:hypothetical protein
MKHFKIALKPAKKWVFSKKILLFFPQARMRKWFFFGFQKCFIPMHSLSRTVDSKSSSNGHLFPRLASDGSHISSFSSGPSPSSSFMFFGLCVLFSSQKGEVPSPTRSVSGYWRLRDSLFDVLSNRENRRLVGLTHSTWEKVRTLSNLCCKTKKAHEIHASYDFVLRFYSAFVAD